MAGDRKPAAFAEDDIPLISIREVIDVFQGPVLLISNVANSRDRYAIPWCHRRQRLDLLRVGVLDPWNGSSKVRFVLLLFLTLARSRVHENRIIKWRRSDGGSV